MMRRIDEAYGENDGLVHVPPNVNTVYDLCDGLHQSLSLIKVTSVTDRVDRLAWDYKLHGVLDPRAPDTIGPTSQVKTVNKYRDSLKQACKTRLPPPVADEVALLGNALAEFLRAFDLTVEHDGTTPFYTMEGLVDRLRQRKRELSGSSIAGTGNETVEGSRTDMQLSARDSPDLPALDDEDIAILSALSDGAKLLTLTEMETTTRITRKTVGDRVSRLIRLKLVHRPRGPKRGSAITADGKVRLEVYRAKTTQ